MARYEMSTYENGVKAEMRSDHDTIGIGVYVHSDKHNGIVDVAVYGGFNPENLLPCREDDE